MLYGSVTFYVFSLSASIITLQISIAKSIVIELHSLNIKLNPIRIDSILFSKNKKKGIMQRSI